MSLSKVNEFGFARIENVTTTMTMEDMGNVAYVAPEIQEGRHVTKNVDVFSFGMILYEMIVGESVFSSDASPMDISKLHKRSCRPKIPNNVRPVIRRIIEKK
jgi:serine/threonine-protein kinase